MPVTERLYYSDSHLIEFEARVVDLTDRVSGWTAVVLDRTAFYPTGGGQPSDTGTLNGVRVASYTIGSDDWRQRLAASKFAGQADFAAARSGHIGLQDHGAVLRVRNARIRALPLCHE